MLAAIVPRIKIAPTLLWSLAWQAPEAPVLNLLAFLGSKVVMVGTVLATPHNVEDRLGLPVALTR